MNEDVSKKNLNIVKTLKHFFFPIKMNLAYWCMKYKQLGIDTKRKKYLIKLNISITVHGIGPKMNAS